MRKKKKKLFLTVFIILICLIGLSSIAWFGFLQETSFTKEFEKSGIFCNTINDCSNYLSNQMVSQENINKVEFKCDKVCYFKEK